MPFTVEDFFDLARLLEQRPEWRAELRRLLLPDEVLSLPQTIQALAGLVEALTKDVRTLTEAQRHTEKQLIALTEAQTALTRDVQLLTKRVDSLGQDVGDLKGITLELRYRDRAPAFGAWHAASVFSLPTNWTRCWTKPCWLGNWPKLRLMRSWRLTL